jgi:hypothetical protein
MNTLLLDTTVWDLCLDTSGDIALATDPYSVAQDVASACRLFLGELWFNTTAGIPYFEEVLGQNVSLQVIKAQLVRAALTVPEVTAAECFLSSVKDRTLSGQVQFTYALPATAALFNTSTAGGNARGVISFVGSNTGLITFVGSNGGVITFFEGS